jgi:hypothetical protein
MFRLTTCAVDTAMQEGSLLYTNDDNDDNSDDIVSSSSEQQQPFKVNWDVIKSLPHVNQVSTQSSHRAA